MPNSRPSRLHTGSRRQLVRLRSKDGKADDAPAAIPFDFLVNKRIPDTEKRCE